MSNLTDLLAAMSGIAQTLLAVATLVLSWVVWKSAGRLARAQYILSLQQSWMTFNSTILQRPELVKATDEILGIPPTDAASMNRRYVSLMMLNVLEAEFVGERAGLSDHGYHHEAIVDILDPMLKNNPELISHIRNYGFHSDFVALCEERAKAKS
jgi:hypothetical protein